jgi:Protein of unknown function (DUF3307)
MALFFQLLIGHALADFVLQSDTMARAKDRHSDLAKSASRNFPPWYYWLGAHALVHGGAVYLFTGSAVLGLIEVMLHSAIDYAKCEHRISFHQDQALHIVCKIGYCFFV